MDVFCQRMDQKSGRKGNMIGVVGVLSHPLLVGVKQGIPVTAH